MTHVQQILSAALEEDRLGGNVSINRRLEMLRGRALSFN